MQAQVKMCLFYWQKMQMVETCFSNVWVKLRTVHWCRVCMTLHEGSKLSPKISDTVKSVLRDRSRDQNIVGS